jgi:hypothetical protein
MMENAMRMRWALALATLLAWSWSVPAAAFTLLPATAITTPVTLVGGAAFQFRDLTTGESSRGPVSIQANFTYGSGGTTVDAYFQTSLDGGTSWADVCHFAFTTSNATMAANISSDTPVTTPATLTDGTMTANTCQDGLMGQLIRMKWGSTGTYAGGTTLQVDVQAGSRIAP